MKILIADKLSKNAVKALEKFGAEVTFNPELTADKIPDTISNNEILIVRSTKVTAETIQAGDSLSLIIRAGAGVNTIDLEAASKKGIYVANCPGKNTDAVAELALGLLIAADRRIVNATNDLRLGNWKKKEYGKANGLKNRTLGIIGLGSIGKVLAKCAKGLEMNVVAWSRNLTEEKAAELEIGFCSTPEEVAEISDAVSIHLASKPETQHFIGEKFLAKMKSDAILINTSRGEVIDTFALKTAITEKNLRVGIDVFENEPAGGDSDFEDKELAELVTATPHIGASTNQAAEAIAAEAVRIVKAYVTTGKPVNSVNIREKSLAKINIVIRHFNQVGVLACVLDELRNEKINIEEMENTIFEGGKTASCTIKLDRTPSEAFIKKISTVKDIVQVMI